MATYTIKAATTANDTTGRTLARTSLGRLWAVYRRSISAKIEICAAYSDNAGVSWTEEQVTAIGADQGRPTCAVDSQDNLHVAWVGLGWGTNTANNNVQWRRRTVDDWQAQEAVTDTANEQFRPAIAVDSQDNVHLVWYGKGWGTNTGIDNIQYRRRVNGTWQAQEAVTDKAQLQQYAVIAIDSSNNAHTVWFGSGWGTNTGYYNIQYRRRTADGWQTQEGITDIGSHQLRSAIAVDASDNIHVAWNGKGWGTNTGIDNIQYRRRTADGWQAQEAVTDATDAQDRPSLVIDSLDNVHLAWQGLAWGVNTTVNNIQYCRRTDSWQAQVGLTDSATAQINPHLAWAFHPTVNGVKPNRPTAGYAFTWEAGTTTTIHLSDDLTWGIGRSMVVRYDLYQLAGRGLAVQYDLYQLAGRDLALLYDLYQLAGRDVSLVYDLQRWRFAVDVTIIERGVDIAVVERKVAVGVIERRVDVEVK